MLPRVGLSSRIGSLRLQKGCQIRSYDVYVVSLSSMGGWRPVDTLRDWADRGILGITAEDIEAWSRTRNPAAHAGLVAPTKDRDETQVLLNRYHRVLNMLNRIVLQLIGYTGQYTDYSRPGWPDVEFPAAATATL